MPRETPENAESESLRSPLQSGYGAIRSDGDRDDSDLIRRRFIAGVADAVAEELRIESEQEEPHHCPKFEMS